MHVSEDIVLSREIAVQLVREAQAARPLECCGVLFGKNGVVERAQSIPNIADDPRTGFYMDETALAAALLSGEPLLGFYHSHPNNDPLPSPADIDAATYPDAAHLIIGLRGEPKLAAWRIVKGFSTRFPLTIGEASHENQTSSADAARAPASQIAIVLAGVLAALMTVLIALSLLPPAPPIPGR